MESLADPRKIRLWQPFLVFTIVALVIVWGAGAVNTNDARWFLPTQFAELPRLIIVREDGQERAFEATTPGFDALATAVNDAAQRTNNTTLINIGLSDETLVDYEKSGLLVIAYYDRPVKFHTAFRTGDPTELLIPIRGRHANQSYFFRGHRGSWYFGAMRMSDPSVLHQALDTLGFATQNDGETG